MYQKAYGIIETLAPLHVGATAGEETGNLNLIFRDQFTQTGIIPSSSIRGRLRADMRGSDRQERADDYYGRPASKGLNLQFESRIKMEYASIVWLPVFCPGQPIIWVSCPRLLRRYQRLAGRFVSVGKDSSGKQKLLKDIEVPYAYTSSEQVGSPKVFFNFGFVDIQYPQQKNLSHWFPLEKMFGYSDGQQLPAVVVGDNDIGMIHDMALYRQSRVALQDKQKVVDDRGAFFNVEALPEGTLLVFPIAIKPPAITTGQDSQENEAISTAETGADLGTSEDKSLGEGQPEKSEPTPRDNSWTPFKEGMEGDLYLGGLESVGFGHCYLTVKGV